jgi:hypothetical protein
MWYHVELGIVHPGQAFTLCGYQYPLNWMVLSTQEERDALGFLPVLAHVRPDERFYVVSENPVSVENGVAVIRYATTPRQIDALKMQMLASVKSHAGVMLSDTDWKVIRAAEGGPDVDTDTAAYRAAVRAASNAHETAIMACTTVDELAALTLDWPDFVVAPDE